MLQDPVLDLLDDPVCRLMMESDHLTRDDELSLLNSVKPLFSFDDEMRQVVNHDQRRWVNDRRRTKPLPAEAGRFGSRLEAGKLL